MTTDVFRTMIVPASLVDLARGLGAGLSPGGAGMFSTGLSPDGTGTPTHYVSTGMIGARFAECIASADTLYAACQEAGATVSLAMCQALVTQSDVTDGTRTIDVEGVATVIEEGPFAVFERLGLQMTQGDI